MKTRSRQEGLLIILLLSFGVVLSLGLCLGSVRLPLRGALGALLKGPGGAGIQEPENTYSAILWTLRFPRVILAFIEGAALGVAGAVMQGLFRNPMADPYVLGVSSGASLGAVIGLVLGIGGTWGVWGLPALSFTGATLSIAVVHGLATHRGRTDTWTLLLSGVALSSLVASAIALIMVVMRERLDEIVFWTMGSLTRATWQSVGAAAVYTAVGMTVLWKSARSLDAISFGEETAFHLGVPIETVKRRLLWAASLVTAASVAFTGPVGFVGLIVPHAVRLIAGPGHRWLMPLSALAGGNVLVLSDLLARTVAPPREIPVGVVTSLLGAPFFLRLLFKARRDK